MSFALQYNRFIESEKGVSKNFVKPRNVYRINTYKYSDGKTKSLSGPETSLVFVLGVTADKKITCVKISLVKPEMFFKWLSNMTIKGLTEKQFEEAKKLDELLVMGDKEGKKFFSNFLKTHPIYNKDPDSYRTYNLSGIKSIEEIIFKKDVILKYIKVKKEKSSSTDTKNIQQDNIEKQK